jgi:glycerol-3-phosphate dehydrogenase
VKAELARGVDVLIVGGGINGTGLARDLALRGARVGLVEKSDLASGTSSRSSRLIHGGLRYLEERQVHLVFESVTERWRLSNLARHLVRPLEFVFPVYRTSRFPLWMVNLGVTVYDALALFRNYENHRRLSRAKLLAEMPALNELSLSGGVAYYDYRTDDARLTLENAIDAREHGAAILTRATVTAPMMTSKSGTRKIAGVVVRDEIGRETFEIPAKRVISTTGPWTDATVKLLGAYSPRPMLRPTKGVHIVVPRARLPVRVAAALSHPRDGRVLFALPFHERAVLGTTDTDFKGAPEDIAADGSDVDYLIEVAAQFFPASQLTHDDVIATWAGLRPLVHEDDVRASGVSREERVITTPEGVIAMFGGKLTTYRLVAEHLGNRLARELGGLGPGVTKSEPLPGSVGLDRDEDLVALEEHLRYRAGISRESALHLAETYGMRATRLLDRASVDPSDEGTHRLYPDLPHLWCEIDWAVEQEMALTLEDVLVRRTGVFYRAMDQGLSIAEKVARRIARVLRWSEDEIARQLDAYRAAVARSRAWRGPASAGATPVRAAG